VERVFISGGAGFIGSHFVERLLKRNGILAITAYDNLSSGNIGYIEPMLKDSRFKLVKGEISDLESLSNAMRGHDTVIHLASNPDIARAATEPSIDFVQGTVLTSQIVEAMRITNTGTILYASGSGIYGDLGFHEMSEDDGPLVPISTYGASKIAGEGLICAYAHMFDLKARAFRFGNVVGGRQTHGVAFDFLRKLKENPNSLEVFGDGTQSKSYVHVDDVIDAVIMGYELVTIPYDVFNVATGDYITVKEIAEIVAQKALPPNHPVKFIYGTEKRGWKGDIPIVRLNTDKIKKLGWTCKRTSKQAIEASVDAMLAQQ
jgi:UDP-glucose 4-epimerase